MLRRGGAQMPTLALPQRRLRSSARYTLSLCVCVRKAKCDNSEKTRTANKMAKVAYFNASLSFGCVLAQLSSLCDSLLYVRMSAACGLGV